MKLQKPRRAYEESETLACRLPKVRADEFKAEIKRDAPEITVSEAIRQLIENFLKLRGK